MCSGQSIPSQKYWLETGRVGLWIGDGCKAGKRGGHLLNHKQLEKSFSFFSTRSIIFIEGFRLEGTLKLFQFQTPAWAQTPSTGAGCLESQPGTLPGMGNPEFQCSAPATASPVKNFFLRANLNLSSMSLKTFSLVLSQHALVIFLSLGSSLICRAHSSDQLRLHKHHSEKEPLPSKLPVLYDPISMQRGRDEKECPCSIRS